MASTYSPTLRIELIGNGEQAGTWGTTTNSNLGSLIEQAITGVQTITMGDATYTLTAYDGAVDEARNAVLVLGGTVTTPQNLIAPSVEKTYIVKNGTGSNVTVKTSGGNGVTFVNNQVGIVYCDGTNFYPAVDVNNITGNVAVTGSITATANITATNRVTANVVSATSYLGLTGRVIQTVVGTAGTAYTTSSSYTSTGMTATITPTSASSKILILAHAMLWQTNYYAGANSWVALYKDGVNLVPGSNWAMVFSQYNAYGSYAISHLDSPASTSALTYAIYFRTNGGDAAHNGDGAAGSIILMEIL